MRGSHRHFHVLELDSLLVFYPLGTLNTTLEPHALYPLNLVTKGQLVNPTLQPAKALVFPLLLYCGSDGFRHFHLSDQTYAVHLLMGYEVGTTLSPCYW